MNPNISLLAVDKKQLCGEYAPAVFIKSDVSKISPKLNKLDIKKIDLLTVFNPFPGIPDLADSLLFTEKDVVLIGCVDWNKNNFEESLKRNGFKPVIWQKNHFQGLMKPWFNNYDPFCFCVLDDK